VVRNAVWKSMVAVDIDHRPAAEDISVRIRLGTVGPIRICSARATAVTLRRTERLARKDEEPAVTLGVQMTGSSVVVQPARYWPAHVINPDRSTERRRPGSGG
jgi:hypothetical protein